MYKDLVDKKGEYNTPKYLFNYLNKHFKFELDPCSTEDNYLGTRFYLTVTGLERDWNVNAFVNPPYGGENERLWINKAIKEFEQFNKNIFLLLPAKTESSWFSQLFQKSTIIIFPKMRIQFIHHGKKKNGNNIGSIIFGLVREFDQCLMTDAEEQVTSFISENKRLNIPIISGRQQYFFFPDRKVLEKNYSYLSTLTGHTK